MKRVISILMILMLACSVFVMNSVVVYAEGEDVGGESTGTEETLPEGDGTENGDEQTPPEGDVTENEGEEKDSEQEAWDNLLGALGEFKLGTSLEELKANLFGIVEKMWSFITSNETYKNIATALVALLAFLIIPVVLGLVVVAYVAGAMVVFVSSALMTVVEVFIKTLMDFGLM